MYTVYCTCLCAWKKTKVALCVTVRVGHVVCTSGINLKRYEGPSNFLNLLPAVCEECVTALMENLALEILLHRRIPANLSLGFGAASDELSNNFKL